MNISSEAFGHHQPIPSKYTCQGENINPPLTFSDVPQNTASLALLVDDPDAATDPDGPGKTFDHWVVFNIDPASSGVTENQAPKGGVVGKNTADGQKYTGPCPPNGTHRYFFKLYALDTKLDLDQSATKEDVQKAIEGHVLDEAELIGTYQKTA